ncbi:MAG TPA: PH domain-containing protein [Chloroflexia bacterium]|nr:PH domain-containing protein [Chloroflexia bacterium]
MMTTPNPQVNSVPAARITAPLQHAQGTSSRTARYRRLIHDLRPGEKVLLLQRRHPLVLLGKLFWPAALFVAWLASLVFVLPLLSSFNQDPLLYSGGPPTWLPMVSWVAWIAVGVAIVLWAAYFIFDWSDHWIALTTRRLIIMDKILFFRETRREAPLAKVQNVIAEYPNALGSSLDFGHIKVDTAGIGVLAFHDVPHPKVLREAIFAQQDAMRANQPPPEDRRRASIEKIVLGADPLPSHERPTPPTGNLPPGSRRGMQPGPPSSVPTNGTFGSLLPFSAQRNGKSVVWHRHWYFLARSVGWPLLIFIASLAGWVASIMLGEPGMVGPIESIMGWVTVALTPICGLWALWNFEDWRNDIYKLDHERVYHVESLPLGMREQSKETLITRITDVTYLVPSPIANLLNFGDVVIKTPGEATEFVFKHIPCPREVQQEIMARVDEYRLKEGAGVDREIEAWIKTYHEANRKT